MDSHASLGCSVSARSHGNLPALFVTFEFEFGYIWVLCKTLMSFLVGKNLCMRALLRNTGNEAGSHLGNWHTSYYRKGSDAWD